MLSGAAARGAFQAGAMSTMLRGLERDGQWPAILVGTSAGAINAAYWGSKAHLGAAKAGDELLSLWREMSDDDVYEPIVCGLLPTLARFANGAVRHAGSGLTSLLDTEPLRLTAAERLDVDQLHSNVTDRVLDAVGVVATRVPPGDDRRLEGMSSGRSVLFLDEHTDSGYRADALRAHDIVRTPILAEHVVASASIPIAFPAHPVEAPPDAAGWYVDGGVRENTPLRHAIRLGADRIVVISATSTDHGLVPPAGPGPAPDIAFAGAQVLHAVLSDRMIEDLLAIRRINHLVGQFRQAAPAGQLCGLPRASRRGPAYRPIELKVISPPPGSLGELAGGIAEDRASLSSLPDEADNFLLARALRGAGDATGYRELVSYLLFDEEYFERSITIGEETAEAVLSSPWTM